MTTDQSFNEEHRFGSASWADAEDARRAGLLGKRGLPLGYLDRKPIRLESDAPILTVAGAGSGKFRDILGEVAINAHGGPKIWLDPRGEIGAVSQHTFAPAGEHAWNWNPFRIAGLTGHSCNPLDILLPGPRLHADTKFLCQNLIPLSGSANGQYFELRAREWMEAIMKALVEQRGGVSFPALWRVINQVEGNPGAWADMLERMLTSAFQDVARVAGEMLTKQQDSPKEFGSIMGEIYAHLSCLSDPAILDSLEDGGFSLRALCEGPPVANVFLNVPAEYLKLWSPILRVIFAVVMLYKSRAPEAQRITMIIDEAAQLGKFEALLHAFSYGRGFGIRTWALFQDIGQIARNFDRTAIQTLMGNAQVRQFFGIRDYETAKLVSEMLGTQTLAFDGFEYQAAARRERWNAAREALMGGDPLSWGYDFGHYDRTSQHRTKQARPLMTPDEILSMPEDAQILFVSGLDLRPVCGERRSYFSQRRNAGRFLPNPYHPPVDRVRVKTRFGSKWARVISEPVPEKWRDFPQYRDGRALHVEGYRL